MIPDFPDQSWKSAYENGFKIVRMGAIPVGADSGLAELGEKTAEILSQKKRGAPPASICEYAPCRDQYLKRPVDYARIPEKPKKLLSVYVDAGNGSAGPVLEKLSSLIPVDLTIGNSIPDGAFTHGVPNPLLPERREETAKNVRRLGADLGIAFDGDFDRCFFYDEKGNFVEGYYLVGLFARELLKERPRGKIVHDHRVYWNTRQMVTEAGGIPIMGKTGHAFMKEQMRRENAVYGGEMSSHHYFRDFAFCDSGILTMLRMLKFLSQDEGSLGELDESRMKAWPCSGEINFRVGNASKILRQAWLHYQSKSLASDRIDGINLEFSKWRFNLRMSNTEPLLRLNLESRGDAGLMKEKRRN